MNRAAFFSCITLCVGFTVFFQYWVHTSGPKQLVGFPLPLHDVELELLTFQHDKVATLRQALHHLRKKKKEVLLLTNGGIFSRHLEPLGLLINKGKQQISLHEGKGWGNFFLKPNGVFWMKDGKAQIQTTSAYAKQKNKPTLALQSGPMLLIDGRIHPRLRKDSKTYYIRNAVCLNQQGEVVVIFQNRRVTLHHFATSLKQRFGCQQALYLDGGISGLWTPRFQARLDRRYASILAVVAKKKAAKKTKPPKRSSNGQKKAGEKGLSKRKG